jgi:hypothetical protein
MLPASAGATAAKVLSFCVFCIMLFVKFPPWGREKKRADPLAFLNIKYLDRFFAIPGFLVA